VQRKLIAMRLENIMGNSQIMSDGLKIDRRLSPCRGVCSTATFDDWCRGCGRSKEQVLDWHKKDESGKPLISDEEKIEIMNKINRATLE